jgi:purine-nucleoside phosphorylase
MPDIKTKAQETAQFLRQRMPMPPTVALLTGTGLGDSTAAMQVIDAIDYRQIPHFPLSTVQSHESRLLYGRLAGKAVLAFQGRFHLYEGYGAKEVTFPVRVMQELSISHLILSNASGGLNPAFAPGDIMLIDDHINLTGENPLVGPNDETLGLRFPDMIEAYDRKLVDLAEQAGQAAGVALKRGVYAGLKGPSLETPAEMRFLRTIGADAVGFSTVMEVIAARHAGIRVLGLSTITNLNDPDRPVPATMEAIIAVACKAAPRLESIISEVVERI